jgi:hypothetical protein
MHEIILVDQFEDSFIDGVSFEEHIQGQAEDVELGLLLLHNHLLGHKSLLLCFIEVYNLVFS